MTTGDDPTGYFSLRSMMIAAVAVWAATFWFVHGPMVFAYLLLHAATTGIFLAAIYFADRNRLARQTTPATIRVATEPSPSHQQESAKRAVAS